MYMSHMIRWVSFTFFHNRASETGAAAPVQAQPVNEPHKDNIKETVFRRASMYVSIAWILPGTAFLRAGFMCKFETRLIGEAPPSLVQFLNARRARVNIKTKPKLK